MANVANFSSDLLLQFDDAKVNSQLNCFYQLDYDFVDELVMLEDAKQNTEKQCSNFKYESKKGFFHEQSVKEPATLPTETTRKEIVSTPVEIGQKELKMQKAESSCDNKSENCFRESNFDLVSDVSALKRARNSHKRKVTSSRSGKQKLARCHRWSHEDAMHLIYLWCEVSLLSSAALGSVKTRKWRTIYELFAAGRPWCSEAQIKAYFKTRLHGSYNFREVYIYRILHGDIPPKDFPGITVESR